MKLPHLSLAIAAMAVLASTGLATDNADWVAQGYRWSLVSGHAYIAKEDAIKERSRRQTTSVSEVARRAYYLRPGKVVLVIETDSASGLSKIRIGRLARDLWTATKNLSTRPVRNLAGTIETPDKSGIPPISGATPTSSSNATPRHR